MGQNHYSVLGIGEKASQEDIKKSFRKLAAKYHPDKPNGDEKKFKEINLAYETLSDPEKRRMYDLGIDDRQSSARNSNRRYEDLYERVRRDFDGGFDFFGRRKRPGPEPLTFSLKVPLKDFLKGSVKSISYSRRIICGNCQGKGAENASDMKRCEYCEGTGRRFEKKGPITFDITCSSCGGRGSVISNPCKKCSGSGFEKKKDKVEVEIHPGMQDGIGIKFENKGHQSLSGEYSDFIVFIETENSPIFSRYGQSIALQSPLPLHKYLIGGKHDVPTIHGTVEMKISPKKTKYILRGKGLPLGDGSFGDQVVFFDVEMPEKIDEDLKKSLQNLESDEKAYPNCEKFKRENIG